LLISALHGEKPFDVFSTCHTTHILINCPLDYLMLFTLHYFLSLLHLSPCSASLSIQCITWKIWFRVGYKNALMYCKRYNCRSVDSFILNSIPLTNTLFTQQYSASMNDLELKSAISLIEVMFVRERHFTSPEFSTLSHAQLTDNTNALAIL
jgi:hypothetical protein